MSIEFKQWLANRLFEEIILRGDDSKDKIIGEIKLND